jgi:hypothetical protein
MGPEYQKLIQEVDPDLIITNHRVTGWAVWREESDEKGTFYRRIAQCKPGVTEFDITSLCAGLRARDTYLRGRSHTDQMEEHLRDLDREERAREAAAADALMPVYDRLAHYAAKASGDLSISISPGSWK